MIGISMRNTFPSFCSFSKDAEARVRYPCSLCFYLAHRWHSSSSRISSTPKIKLSEGY